MIQPAGLGGSPDSGHRFVAISNASWTASSAISISPKKRTRLATDRREAPGCLRPCERTTCTGSCDCSLFWTRHSPGLVALYTKEDPRNRHTRQDFIEILRLRLTTHERDDS